jgi:staphylococcal nuclease domain-containing protein 1
MMQGLCWGKDLQAKTLAPDDSGKLAIVIMGPEPDETINARLIAEGLARVAKPAAVDFLANRMVDKNVIIQLAADLSVAQETARKSRVGMWRYGDIGDDDPDEL